MDYDTFMARLQEEMHHLGFRDATSLEVAEGVDMFDRLTAWLRPQLPVLVDTAQLLNGSYLLSLQAAGIELDPDQLSEHTLSVTMVLLAKMVRSGAIQLPPPC